jgi:hypothetical protein
LTIKFMQLQAPLGRCSWPLFRQAEEALMPNLHHHLLLATALAKLSHRNDTLDRIPMMG